MLNLRRSKGNKPRYDYAGVMFPSGTDFAPGTAGNSQRIVNGAAIPARWQNLFQSPALDELVHRSLANNSPLAATRANLHQHRGKPGMRLDCRDTD